MHPAQEFQTVKSIVDVVKREKEEKLEEYSSLFIFHPFPDELLVADNNVFLSFKGVKAAISHQVK